MSNNITWKESYKVGHDVIDQEHENLFFIAFQANTVSSLTNEKEQKLKLKDILHELYDYVDTHFKHEEDVMVTCNYPEYEAHIVLHKKMLKELNNIVIGLSVYETTEVIKELTDFIQIIFLKHIQTQDTKISQWIKK